MYNGVFISYRRDDSSAYTRALFEALRARLGERQVFMDVDAIEPGVDFLASIQNAVGRCEALIAVIGTGWLEATDDAGQRRLDNEHDYVRIEIATALQRNVRVIPVLLDGVKMPSEEVEQLKTAEGLATSREAAEAARRIGALLMLRDTGNALSAYERAAELDPAHLETRFQLGRVREYAGQLTAAQSAYERALALSQTAGDGREAARTGIHIGSVRRAQGDLAGALDAYQQGQDIFKRLATADPGNSEWQRDLSISHERIGDVRSAQGDLAGALDAYQQDLDIAERLASADPSNAGWQTDIAVSCWKLAEVLRGMPDRRAGARPYLERGRAVLVALHEQSRLEPSKLEWIDMFDQALTVLDSGGD